MQLLLFFIVGGLCAFLVPSGSWTGQYGQLNTALIPSAVEWFFIGGFVSTIFRFVGPKRIHVITFLGTWPMQVLNTGIRVTLPWPLGWVSAIISTNVLSEKHKVQIKSKDNIVFNLPVTFQWHVIDGMKFAFERSNPKDQMVQLGVASVRAAGNAIDFQNIYSDKDEIRKDVDEHIAADLATFGVMLDNLVIEDPDLPESLAKSLNSIREAEYGRAAAAHNAETTYINMVGQARATAEATRLKGAAISGFRLQIAEGNAAAIAVMQGRLAVRWEDEETTVDGVKRTTKVAKFVEPEEAGAGQARIPTVDIDAQTILDFFKVVDTNDAIRDAAQSPGTVVVVPGGGNNGPSVGEIAALTRAQPLKAAA